MIRAITKGLMLGGLVLLGIGALAYGRPDASLRSAEIVADSIPAAPTAQLRTDTVYAGEPLMAVFERHGLGFTEAQEALASLTLLDARRVRAGTQVTARIHPDSGVQRLSFKMGIDRVIRLARSSAGWSESEVNLPWTTDTVAVAGVVASTLTGAIVKSATGFPDGARLELAYNIADVLEYRVDLSRDLRVGDSITALVERETAEGGYVRPGRVLAARAKIGGSLLEAVRFEDEDGQDQYYDADGRSLRAAFLRAPLAFRRISSVYGNRKHPILKTFRRHTGIDYAAASGTPVRAIGDGQVVFAGWKGGYGRTVELRHKNGMVTRYGHLSRISKGIKVGQRVAISTTIGAVGMTGLATGPHLHFETLFNGKHRDPRQALKNVGSGEPIPDASRAAFALRKQALLSDLGMRMVAMNDGPDRIALPKAVGRRVDGPRAVGAGH